jgi:hypothetical protein
VSVLTLGVDAAGVVVGEVVDLPLQLHRNGAAAMRMQSARCIVSSGVAIKQSQEHNYSGSADPRGPLSPAEIAGSSVIAL